MLPQLVDASPSMSKIILQKIVGFNASEYHLGCKAGRSGVLRVDFDHLEVSNVRLNLDKRTLSLSGPISEVSTAAGIEPGSSDLAAQLLNH